MKALVVEDEEALGGHLENNLKDLNFEVSRCREFEALKSLIQSGSGDFPDVVILDRLLQDHDSIELIPQIKAQWPTSRLLVLSAIGGALEKSRALDAGADDYVSKPFASEELASRIRALLRRTAPSQHISFELGNLKLDPLEQVVMVNSERLDLSRKEFQVLTLFLQNPSKVFNRLQLLERVWNIRNDVESNVVEVTMKNLRRKLEVAQSSLKILSKRFVGYWIEA